MTPHQGPTVSEEWQRSKFEQKTSCLWSYFSNTHRSDEEESILYGQLWTRLPASANHIGAHSTITPEETLILKNISQIYSTSRLEVSGGGDRETFIPACGEVSCRYIYKIIKQQNEC